MTSDERRERYAAAIAKAWMTPGVAQSHYPEAEAAMAVADEESAQLTEAYVAARCEVSRSHREVGRLAAENARLRAEHDADKATGQVAYDRAVAAEQENACLRRELEATRRAKQETDDRHAATIADLRNALEERYEHRGVDDLANSIYGVLERDSND